ncbi:MAG: AAA family ATPase [Nitrosomonadales bacterium]|nr:AAA family ATPase [Nitrosomonadales bacterium]
MISASMGNDFKNGPQRISDALQDMVADLNRRQASDDPHKVFGIRTGFADLDKITSGMRPGSLIVVASRPSIGKSTFALNIASHVALDVKLPVLMFSMEMSAMAVSTKLASQIGNIETTQFRTGKLDENDRQCLDAALEKLEDAPFYVDDVPSLTVEEVLSRTHDVITQQGHLGLIVIDYLQLMDPIYSGDSSDEDYECVMSSLKKLARETNTPVILLSQLNRKMEKRRNKRPRLSDLPARAIGQYADLLMFLYRDECYDHESEDAGTAELTIGRHRYGATGMITLGSTRLKFSEFSNFNDPK